MSYLPTRHRSRAGAIGDAEDDCDAEPNSIWNPVTNTCDPFTGAATQATQDECNNNPGTVWNAITNTCQVAPATPTYQQQSDAAAAAAIAQQQADATARAASRGGSSSSTTSSTTSSSLLPVIAIAGAGVVLYLMTRKPKAKAVAP